MASLSTTPLAIDEYARFMTEAFNERSIIGVTTVFQSFFGVPANNGKTLYSPDSAVVDIDIMRGNERLAKMIPRGSQARVLDRKDTTQKRFTTQSRIYPLIEEEGNIEGNQLLFRNPGESPFSSATRLDRMRLHALEHHQEHVRRMVRLHEYLAAQSVLTGKMPAIFGTADDNLIYDFLRNEDLTISAENAWDTENGTPFADIDGACALLREKGHVTPDMVIMGTSVIDAFIGHADVIAKADNRRFEIVQIGGTPVPPKLMKFVEAGLVPRGRLLTPHGYELWVFTYLDIYTDDAGTATPYMPIDECLIACSTARCDRYFGPPESLPNVPAREQLYQQLFGFPPGIAPLPPKIKGAGQNVNASMFYFDAYVSENWKRVTARTQSAPIFATTQTDAFAVLNSLITA